MGRASSVRVTVLIDNTTHYEGPILAENGLSLLIEAESKGSTIRVLLDTGLTGDTLINNCKELGINLSQVDAVVISHNHYDHTGGLLKVLDKIKKPVPVIMHPDVFQPKYAILPSLGINKLTYTGPPYARNRVEEKEGILVLSRDSVPIGENVMTTGEITRKTSFEKPEGFYVIKGGSFKRDSLPDDQALLVNMDEGLIIITGCGHSGVINTIMHATEITNAEKICAVIGGFHLIDATEKKIDETISELKRINPEIIAPMHCTGFKAKKKISDVLPSAFRELYCGDRLEIPY